MESVFYIITTAIFGLFILVTIWFVYRYVGRKSLLERSHEELTEDQKALLLNFCRQMRREDQEEKKKKKRKTPLPTKTLLTKK